MSLYEVLVVVALAGAGGCAYFLYRSDTRSPGARRSEAAGEPMFGRTPRKPTGDGAQPGSTADSSGDRRK